MFADLRNLESRYSLNSYPYADSEYSQDRLRALGIATDQLVEAPENPAPKIVPNQSGPVGTKSGRVNKLPLILIAALVFLWFKTK